jgi:hypothetical protein
MQFVGSGGPPKIRPMILFHWFCCFVSHDFQHWINFGQRVKEPLEYLSTAEKSHSISWLDRTLYVRRIGISKVLLFLLSRIG